MFRVEYNLGISYLSRCVAVLHVEYSIKGKISLYYQISVHH